MNEKFTPGPWRRAKKYGADHKPHGYSICRVEDSRGRGILFTVPFCSRSEQIANLDLSSTAPEMYELLNEICSKIFDGTVKNEDARKIENLLIKARGGK